MNKHSQRVVGESAANCYTFLLNYLLCSSVHYSRIMIQIFLIPMLYNQFQYLDPKII